MGTSQFKGVNQACFWAHKGVAGKRTLQMKVDERNCDIACEKRPAMVY